MAITFPKRGAPRPFFVSHDNELAKIVFRLLFRRENGPRALLISITTRRYLYEMYEVSVLHLEADFCK